MSLIQIHVTAFTVVAARSAFKPFNKLKVLLLITLLALFYKGKIVVQPCGVKK